MFSLFQQIKAKQIMTWRAASARFPVCGPGYMFYSPSFVWLTALRLTLEPELLRRHCKITITRLRLLMRTRKRG